MKELAHNILKLYMRNFPISKGKNRVLSRLWKPLSFGRYERECVLRQADIRMNCDLTKLIQRTIYFRGSYEDANTDYWLKLAAEAQVIFDVGANVGLYSLLAAAVNPKATVHAFEPTAELAETFAGNILLNKMRNITLNTKAVGKTTGKAFLQRYAGGGDNSNEGMNFIKDVNTEAFDQSVDVVSIDDYCKRNQIARIDLMKIDIEGGEYDALLGARRLLQAKTIGCIFIELIEWAANRSGHSTKDIKEIIRNAGYDMFTLRGNELTPTPLEGVHYGDSNVIAYPRDAIYHI